MVAQRAGGDLQGAPHGRVDGLEDTDPLHSETEGGEEQGEHAPPHAVVEVVDEPGLRTCEEVAVLERGPGEDLPEAKRGWLGRV